MLNGPGQYLVECAEAGRPLREKERDRVLLQSSLLKLTLQSAPRAFVSHHGAIAQFPGVFHPKQPRHCPSNIYTPAMDLTVVSVQNKS